MRYPSVNTKLIVLLGQPLGHSYSALMHNAVFEHLRMDCLYLPVEVSTDNLETVFNGLMHMNVGGFNVTIPHKQRIMKLLDDMDPMAASIGAVNTICIDNGRTIGHNTDGEGFVKSLEEGLSISIVGQNVCVLGCGGAARAIAMTLASRGAAKIFLSNRTVSKAEELAAAVNTQISHCAEVVDLRPDAIKAAIRSCQILVNTTSVGMHPHVDSSPLDSTLLSNHLAVLDIVYNPLMTRMLLAARDKGCRIVDGLGMLVYQGAAAFRLWTGVDPPAELMFDTIRYHMGLEYPTQDA